MDLGDLHIFRTVVQAGGVTRAAEKTQPRAVQCHHPRAAA